MKDSEITVQGRPKPRAVAIVQARMGSTRLPGKVLKELAGEPVLARVVQRLSRATQIDEVVVATTQESQDDVLAETCSSRGWHCFRGSEQDVLDRYYQAARQHRADIVVRITSDCPLIDPGIVDALVFALRLDPIADYATNTLAPRTYPRGLDVEVMTFDALAKAWREACAPAEREHVTPYLYRNPASFRLRGLWNDTDYSALRWTVDTEEDLALVRLIYDHFKTDTFTWQDALRVVSDHPEWSEINSQIEQKAV